MAKGNTKSGLLHRGQMVDERYLVKSIIAHSASSEVYAVEDTLLNGQLLALKIFCPLVSRDPRLLTALQQEILVNRTLRHPSIIQLYNSSIGESSHDYITMEIVDGCTLENLLNNRNECLSVEEAIYVFFELAAGLSYAHQHSVVHRNLQFNQALVSRRGDIRLKGLGRPAVIGRRVLPDSKNRIFLEAPETTKDGIVDELSNQYSLGILLFGLLAGPQYMINRPRPELLADMRSIREVPTWVAELIHTCTKVSVGDRFDSIEQALLFAEAQTDIDSLEIEARSGLKRRILELTRVTRPKRPSTIGSGSTKRKTRFRPSSAFKVKKSS